MKTIGKVDSEVVVTKAQDDNKDIEANKCTISIPDNICLSLKLPAYLKNSSYVLVQW